MTVTQQKRKSINKKHIFLPYTAHIMEEKKPNISCIYMMADKDTQTKPNC